MKKNDSFKYLDMMQGPTTSIADAPALVEQSKMSNLAFMKWLSSSPEEIRVASVNALINKYLFSIGGKHEELVSKLLKVSTMGTSVQGRYTWYGKRAKNKSTDSLKIICEVLESSPSTVLEAISVGALSVESVIESLMEFGYDDKEIKSIIQGLF